MEKDASMLLKVLTKRELELLALLWRHPDSSNHELAKMLCITEACVRFHLCNIYQKLNIKKRSSLILLCQEVGFDMVAGMLVPRELYEQARNDKLSERS